MPVRVALCCVVLPVQAGGKPIFTRMYPVFLFIEWSDGVDMQVTSKIPPLGSPEDTRPAVSPHVVFDGIPDATSLAHSLGWPIVDRYSLVRAHGTRSDCHARYLKRLLTGRLPPQ